MLWFCSYLVKAFSLAPGVLSGNVDLGIMRQNISGVGAKAQD